MFTLGKKGANATAATRKRSAVKFAGAAASVACLTTTQLDAHRRTRMLRRTSPLPRGVQLFQSHHLRPRMTTASAESSSIDCSASGGRSEEVEVEVEVDDRGEEEDGGLVGCFFDA